jgi:hypothetical protein
VHWWKTVKARVTVKEKEKEKGKAIQVNPVREIQAKVMTVVKASAYPMTVKRANATILPNNQYGERQKSGLPGNSKTMTRMLSSVPGI